METGRTSTARAPGMPGSPTSRPLPFGNFVPQNASQPRTSQDRPAVSRNYSTSPKTERRSLDHYTPPSFTGASDVEALVSDADDVMTPASALLLRKLSGSMTPEALNSMLLFASDLLEARFLKRPEFHDERGFQTAIAVFSTLDGALEVRKKLHGKPNPSNEGTMIVEIIKGNDRGMDNLQRRPSDAQPRRPMPLTNGNGLGMNGQTRPSRFTSAFQSLDQVSPTRQSRGSGTSDLSSTDAGSNQHMQDLFGPQSPVKAYTGDRHRNSVRAMTGDDATDDEERELLSNPLAFAEGNQRQKSMRATISQFSNLHLDTSSNPPSDADGLISPKTTSYGAGRQLPPPQAVHSPQSEYSAPFSPLSPGNGFPVSPQQYPRHQFPPANPADQNPPCNTLYVGNLPHETSEDELKSIFSRQRGYKRLCFRTKHNGPMCFVEFEDVSFATKALKELYGVTLHNSQRGGIRLSFSKNPLGVRNGQGNLISPLNSPMAGYGNGGFPSVNGPPPGLGFIPANTATNGDGNQVIHGLNIYATASPPQVPMSHSGTFQSHGFSNGYMTGSRGYGSIGAGLGDQLIRR